MLPSDVAGERPQTRHQKNIASVSCVVVAAVEVETSLRPRLGLQGPPDVVDTWFQNREQPRITCFPVEFATRRVHVRLVSYPRRQVDDVACVHAELGCVTGILASPNRRGASRRKAISSSNVNPLLDHAVIRRGIDGRVLAADTMMAEQLHELCLGELGAVVRAKAPHDGRQTLGVDAGQKTREGLRDVGPPLQELRPSQSRVVVDDHHQVLRTTSRRRLLSRQIHE